MAIHRNNPSEEGIQIPLKQLRLLNLRLYLASNINAKGSSRIFLPFQNSLL
jgi:hypothetical protein